MLVLLGFASLPLLLGQPQATPAFEVTSVKVNKLRYPDIKYPEMSCSGTRFMARWYTPSHLIKWAYQLELSDPIGLPAWAGNMDRMYDIEAKAGAPMSEDQCRLMVRTLLADRFKLRVGWELRETPAYALVVAKGGAKMRKVNDSEPADTVVFVCDNNKVPMFPPGLKGWTMERLAFALRIARLDRAVVDRTELVGAYQFKLEFRRESAPAESGTDVRTELRKLGLQLEARKEPVTQFVVNHIEEPDAN
jgi:uncharacterized protein (TIGR03435 family)